MLLPQFQILRPVVITDAVLVPPGLGLQVQGLRVVFDGFVAVDGVSFEVAPGQSFGIVGESGSGKSTVLRALCGLAPRAAGLVALTSADGRPSLPEPGSKSFRRQVQMVFQDPYGSLHPRQTVDRILADRVERAAWLISVCRERIAGTRLRVDELVAELIPEDPTG